MKRFVFVNVVVLTIALLLEGCCFNSNEMMRTSVRNYVKSIYTDNYELFDKYTYTSNSDLKINTFKSLVLAYGLNKSLKDRYGYSAVEDFNLNCGGFVWISSIPIDFNYDLVDGLTFTKMYGKKGVFEDQTKTFFQFKYSGDILKINLESDVVDMEKYNSVVAETLRRLSEVQNRFIENKDKEMDLEEFASWFVQKRSKGNSPIQLKFKSFVDK